MATKLFTFALCINIVHVAHSLKQDSTGLGGHKAWTDSPFLKGSLSILGCDSVSGWSVQKGRVVGDMESGVPRAGGQGHVSWAGLSTRQSHWSHYSISCHLSIFSLSTFFPSPKSLDSSLMAASEIQMMVSSCFSAIYLLCDIQSTLLSPIYTLLSVLFFFFLSHTYTPICRLLWATCS